MAGICLPPSIGGAVVNLAASLLGKPAVNLNYTASVDGIRSALEQCNIRTVVSSRTFLEKIRMELPTSMVPLEDLMKRRSGPRKVLDAILALILPTSLLRRWLGANESGPPELATVIFSSWQHWRAEGRDADARQHPVEHSECHPALRAGAAALSSGRSSVLPLDGLHLRSLGPVADRHERRLSFESPGCSNHRRARGKPPRDAPVCNTDLHSNVCPPLQAGGVR